MSDPWGEPARPVPDSHCPWCSAEVKGDPVNCPSCGAALREETAADIPGVTQLDPAAGAVARPAPRSRGLLGWLSGEYESDEAAGERASVSPPSEAVRLEMARLEMEAIRAEIEAAQAVEAADETDAALAPEPQPAPERAPAREDDRPPDAPAA